MKIFVSWSGTSSHETALLLREWLRRVLQYSDPFVSSEDISKGAQWLVTISDQLRDTSEGIVCVTPSNVEAPWLNYEAGALAKTTGQTAVRTVLLGLTAGDLPAGAPLSNFQHTNALDEAEMWSLIESIHARHTRADTKSMDRVRWAFDQAWPDLQASLGAIDVNPSGDAEQENESDQESLIRDVLQEVKGISIAVASLRRESPSQTAPETAHQAPLRWNGVSNPHTLVARVAPGVTVRHQSFGEGVVQAVEGQGDKKVAHVHFSNVGSKKLLLRYAPLTIAEQPAAANS
jgi:hypothetical protein